jgi:hypothetical protein
MVGQLGWTRMRVEVDEDLELEFSGRYVYVQVKSRSKLVQFSDIASALERKKAGSHRETGFNQQKSNVGKT